MSKLKNAITKDDHQRGNLKGTAVLVEYGDYQCPHCGIAYPFINKLLKEFDNVLFVFRNFPMPDSHPAALISAQAAEAAAKQNKFWEMHDGIYEHQNRLSNSFLEQLASDINLDKKKFTTDFNSKDIKTHIEKDFHGGMVSGVNGTPCFFLNGVRIDTYDETYESLAEAVKAKR